MKKISSILIIAVMIIAGCNQQVQTEPVDMDAVKDAVTQIADRYLDAWNSRDLDVLSDMVTDDGIFFGTDPSELMDKTSLLDMYTQLFSDTTVDYSYDIDSRKIKVAVGGRSAIVVEYFSIDDWSPKIPLRQTSHVVETNNTWKIDFIAWGFIAKNEDVGKLNKALE